MSANGTWTSGMDEKLQIVKFFSVVFMNILNICIIAGNGVLILALITSRCLRRPTYYFIASLIISDLALGIFDLPFFTDMTHTSRWRYGDNACRLWLTVHVCLCTASIYNLIAIAGDRMFAVTRPLSYKATMTPVKARLVIAAVWLGAFAVALVSSIPGIFRVEPDSRNEPNASSEWSSSSNSRQTLLASATCSLRSLSHKYTIFHMCFSFYIPILALMLAYASIYRTTRRVKLSHRTGQLDIPSVASVTSFASQCTSASSPSHGNQFGIGAALSQAAAVGVGIGSGLAVISGLGIRRCGTVCKAAYRPFTSTQTECGPADGDEPETDRSNKSGIKSTVARLISASGSTGEIAADSRPRTSSSPLVRIGIMSKGKNGPAKKTCSIEDTDCGTAPGSPSSRKLAFAPLVDVKTAVRMGIGIGVGPAIASAEEPTVQESNKSCHDLVVRQASQDCTACAMRPRLRSPVQLLRIHKGRYNRHSADQQMVLLPPTDVRPLPNLTKRLENDPGVGLAVFVAAPRRAVSECAFPPEAFAMFRRGRENSCGNHSVQSEPSTGVGPTRTWIRIEHDFWLRMATRRNRFSVRLNNSWSPKRSAIERYQQRLAFELRALKTFALVSFCFLLCWIGFCVVASYDLISPLCHWQSGDVAGCTSEWILQIVTALGYVNSALNPFIYGVSNRNFRAAFKSMITLRCRK